jgi:DNA-binding NtrC family response regulator
MESAGRILIVDGEKDIRSVLNEYFTGEGYEVVDADSGQDALGKLIPGKFDCVISDLNMPGMDGIGLLKQIKLKDMDVRFFIITGKPEIDSAIIAIKEGACDYLSKPFRMDEIQLKVERAINMKRTEASLRKVKSTILTLIILIPVLISLGIIFGIFWSGIK